MSESIALSVVAMDERLGCPHVPPKFEGHWFGTFDPTVGKAAAVALATFRRLVAGDIRYVLVTGPVGCGKSHLAASACNEAASPLQGAVMAAEAEMAGIDAEARSFRESVRASYTGVPDEARSIEFYRTEKELGRRRDRAAEGVRLTEYALERRCPVWVSVPVLLGRMRREMNSTDRGSSHDVEEAMDTRGILVLDDLGSEKASEWTAAALFEIVSARYDHQLPIVVTSNLTASQLDAAGYGRIVSRLQDEGCLVEMASASDYRARLRRPAR